MPRQETSERQVPSFPAKDSIELTIGVWWTRPPNVGLLLMWPTWTRYYQARKTEKSRHPHPVWEEVGATDST